MGKRFRVGLALGGGGVRGLAHIGVLRVFEQEGIPIDYIVGTSMGAVIGAGYALLGQSLPLEQKVLELLKRDEIVKLEALAAESRPEEKRKIIESLASFVKELLLWNLKGIKRCITSGAETKMIIKELTKDADFSQTKIPFACVACDLRTGEEVILKTGRMVESIMASSSVPAVFPPVEIGKRLLVDGAMTSEVPVEAVRSLGLDFVIAVNVESKIFYEKFRNGMDILFQSDEIRSHELIRLKLAFADFVINPWLEDISWAAFSKGQTCIQQGEQAARQSIKKLKQALVKKRRMFFFKKIFFR
ncbi:patatin-like phospholipase family protein [Candidatus Omnitrophota bacterium]